MSTPLILVAEDERDIRDLIVFTLQISGFEVVDAPNGEEAVKKASEIKNIAPNTIPKLINIDGSLKKGENCDASIFQGMYDGNINTNAVIKPKTARTVRKIKVT